MLLYLVVMRKTQVTCAACVAVLIICCSSIDGAKKRSKEDFSLETLISGLNKNEKQMFKEELGKEFKKFSKLSNKYI